MPRNTFRRPQTVVHNHNVPRHGAPIPTRKVEAPKLAPAKPEATLSLPVLEVLLKSGRS